MYRGRPNFDAFADGIVNAGIWTTLRFVGLDDSLSLSAMGRLNRATVTHPRKAAAARANYPHWTAPPGGSEERLQNSLSCLDRISWILYAESDTKGPPGYRVLRR